MAAQIAWTAVAAVLCVAVLAAHELGHLAAYGEAGIAVRRFGVGAPLWPRLTFKPSRRRPFTVEISPWLVMAYVEPVFADPDEPSDPADTVPFRQAAWIYGAGVIVNITVALILLAGYAAIRHAWLTVAVCVPAAVLLWAARRSAVFAVVPAGLATFTLIVVWLAGALRSGQSGGVVGIPALLVSAGPQHAVLIAAVLSAGLAMLNMAPLMPLDGGKIVRAVLLRRNARAAGRFTTASGVLFSMFIAAALLSDVLYLTAGVR